MNKPWEKSPLEIEIEDGYSAKVVGETEDEFCIEFHDRDMSVVEAKAKKSGFKGFPYEIGEGVRFGVMQYRIPGLSGLYTSYWPIKHYWNPELVKNPRAKNQSPERKIQPWEMTPKEVEITDAYEAEITGEKDDNYFVEFRDQEMEVVEAEIKKTDFEYFPHPVKAGTAFVIVTYKLNGVTGVGSWPITKYWNQELRDS
ncbi:hypothetical protein KY312_01815 [Candidatus Woesearchaeota archaeon]|nr:hypothetical protein [Candidatus Woesearchaeota archaeon]